MYVASYSVWYSVYMWSVVCVCVRVRMHVCVWGLCVHVFLCKYIHQKHIQTSYPQSMQDCLIQIKHVCDLSDLTCVSEQI